MTQPPVAKHWDEVKVPFLLYDDALMLLYTREFFRWSQSTDKDKKDLIERTINYLKRCYYLDPEELIAFRSNGLNQKSPRQNVDDFYSLICHLMDLTTVVLDEAARLKNAGVIEEWMQKKIADSVSGPLNAAKGALTSLRESITG